MSEVFSLETVLSDSQAKCSALVAEMTGPEFPPHILQEIKQLNQKLENMQVLLTRLKKSTHLWTESIKNQSADLMDGAGNAWKVSHRYILVQFCRYQSEAVIDVNILEWGKGEGVWKVNVPTLEEKSEVQAKYSRDLDSMEFCNYLLFKKSTHPRGIVSPYGIA